MNITGSLENNQYYQMNNKNNAAVETGPVQTTAPLSVATSTTLDNAYLLDLSDEAKSFLSNPTQAFAKQSASSQFLLSRKEQEQIDDILQKYKDAPYTQETFNKIQDDLKSAGLSPDRLAQKEKIREFNPTQLFIEALNGGGSSMGLMNMESDDKDTETKSESFMKQLLTDWQSTSTTYVNESQT